MKQILFKLFENLKQLGIKPNIGSRTNVTPIPGSEIDRLINRPVTPKQFDYSKPEVIENMKSIVQNASDYVGQFTERQLKTFNDNVERIIGAVKPKETTAEVVDIATKEKITGPGLESLMREKGVAPISRKTIEAETLIKQFVDDDLISLNAKQIDQLSRGKAEDVFEGIFGSKAKELITGKNTNESLNEVYNKLKTTKDAKGRLPDDPNFDPTDINFKDGGSVSEDVKKLLREEFIELINEDPESFPDTNAGFRRFLKRKGSPVFNYKKGGKVKEPEKSDVEIEEEIRENKKELLKKDPLLNFYKGNTLFGFDLDFANKNKSEDFGKFTSKDIKDPRIGLTIVPDAQDDTSSRWGVSIGPKGGGLTFYKPFSQMSLSDWEEIPESWYQDNIPDVDVSLPELPEMKKGGKVREKAEEPLSKYKSYSENELLSSLDAKMPNLEIIDDELITMPIFEPRDIVPKGSVPVMPSDEYLMKRLFLDLADGGKVKKRKPYADGGYTIDDLLKQAEIYSAQRNEYKPFYSNTYDDYNKNYWLYNDPLEFFNRPYYTNEENLQKYISSVDKTLNPNFSFNNVYTPGLVNTLKNKINFENMGQDPEQQILNSIKYKIEKAFTPENTYGAPGYKPYGVDTYFARDPSMEFMGSQGSVYSNLYNKDNKIVNEPLAFAIRDSLLRAQNELPGQKDFFNPYISKLENDLINLKNLNLNQTPIGNSQGTPFINQSQVDPFSNIPQVDPFTGDVTTQQDRLEFQMPQDMFPQQTNMFPTSDNIFDTLNLGSSDPALQALGKSVGSLDYGTMNALRNNQSLSNYFIPMAEATYGKTAFDAFNQIGLTPAKQALVNQALSSPSGIANALLGEVGGGFKPTPGGVGLGEYISQGLRSLGQASTLNTTNFGVNPAVGGGTLGSRVLGTLIGAPAIYATALLNPTTMGNAELTPQMKTQQTNMRKGGRVNKADGGLTKTIPPVRGPNPQGVESLFKRRYN